MVNFFEQLFKSLDRINEHRLDDGTRISATGSYGHEKTDVHTFGVRGGGNEAQRAFRESVYILQQESEAYEGVVLGPERVLFVAKASGKRSIPMATRYRGSHGK